MLLPLLLLVVAVLLLLLALAPVPRGLHVRVGDGKVVFRRLEMIVVERVV